MRKEERDKFFKRLREERNKYAEDRKRAIAREDKR